MKKNRIIFIIAVVTLAILGEYFIPENISLGRKNIRLIIENTYIYGLIYLPVPIIFITKFKKNLFYKILFFPVGIFLISYLYRTGKSGEFIGIFYLFTYLIIKIIKKEYPEEIKSIGLHKDRIRESIIAGIIASLLLSGHLVFTVDITSYYHFKMMEFDKFFYWIFFETGLDALGEEMFYRGLIFRELWKEHFNFWGSAFLSTFFYILVYLAKPYAFRSSILLICIIFYHLLQGIISCYIYRKTNNLTGCIILNVCFSMVANSLVLP